MITIDPFDKDKYEEIIERWDRVAKPLRGLGRFEEMTARIGAVQGSADIDIGKRAVVIMCADNGIVEEGISQSGQNVTAAVASWMGRGESSVCRMAAACGADTIPVDVGINMEGSPDGVTDRKVMKGTRNFAKEPAMTEEECMQAVNAGIDVVCECSIQGYRLIATGEMGIGNTTTSAALTAALLGLDGDEVTGRGAGLSDAGLEHKKKIIREALDRYVLKDEDRMSSEYTMKMLAAVGGLDIAALAGVFIGGAIYHIPVVIDGFISAAAALAADGLAPGCRDYMLASHCGREPGMKRVLDALGLEPVIDAGLALGEGTGAVMLFPLLDAALSLYSDGLAFEDTEVEQYEHFADGSSGQTVLIIGHPDSGKSKLAEQIVTEMSPPGERIYLATMIPYGDEGRERIEKHRRMREGKGFVTVEAAFDVSAAVDKAAAEGSINDPACCTILLECLSNLTANELFERRMDAAAAAEKITDDILKLSKKALNLVIVSNHFDITKDYDDETWLYAQIMDAVNDRVAAFADKVIRLSS